MTDDPKRDAIEAARKLRASGVLDLMNVDASDPENGKLPQLRAIETKDVNQR